MRRFTVLALISILFSFDTKANVTKVYGNGFLEINKDLPTLHLKGTEYEMGKQYGYLAGDRVAANIKNLKSIGDAQSPQIKILTNFIFTWPRKTAESISRETAMPGSSLQTAVYANTDRDMWVSFSKILEDGSVIEANQQEHQNIPFKDYLTDLEVVDGKLQIKNWLNSRSDLRLKILSKNKIIESDLYLQKRSLKHMNLNVSEGDIIELYSQNKLIDRLVQ